MGDLKKRMESEGLGEFTGDDSGVEFDEIVKEE